MSRPEGEGWPAARAPRHEIHALLRRIADEAHRNLRNESARPQLDHLLVDRGLLPARIQQARLGYIPPGAAPIRDMVIAAGGNLETARAGGLLRLRNEAVDRAARAANVPKDDAARSAWLEANSQSRPGWYADYYHQYLDPSPTGETNAPAGHWLTMPLWACDEDGQAVCHGIQLRSCYGAERIGKRGRYRNPPVTVATPVAAPLAGLVEDEALLRIPYHPLVVCEGGYDRLAIVEALTQMYGEKRPAVIALGTTAAVWGDPRGDSPGLSLSSLTPRSVILWTDTDKPGLASRTTLSAAFAARGHDVKIVRHELEGEAKDPSEMWVRNREGFEAAWETGLGYSALDWQMDLAPALPQGTDGALHRLMERLDAAMAVAPPVRTLRWTKALAQRVGVDFEVVLAWSKAQRPPGQGERRP